MCSSDLSHVDNTAMVSSLRFVEAASLAHSVEPAAPQSNVGIDRIGRLTRMIDLVNASGFGHQEVSEGCRNLLSSGRT